MMPGSGPAPGGGARGGGALDREAPDGGGPDALAAEVLKRIDSEGIRTVRLVLTDLYGVARGKVVTAARMERALTQGHPFATPLIASNLWQRHAPGQRRYSEDIGYRNGLLRLDPATFAPLPWTSATGHVLTDLHDHTGAMVGAAPRTVLRRVLADARALGIEPLFGSELEFYVYRPEPDGGFSPAHGEQAWFSLHAMGLAEQFVDRLDEAASVMGLAVYEVFAEHGAGQFEVNLEPGTGVHAIDRAVALKIAIKEVARSLGLRATFMARPTSRPDTPPSGYHLHQALLGGGGENLLADPADPDGLTGLARHYVAGQLAHAPAMTALASPTITGYKRYQPGTWAPVQIAWGIENRTAMVRALPAGDGTRIENRLGGSDANPYLLAAAMVAAGLDGIRRGLDPGPPAQQNLFTDMCFPALPASPPEALSALAADAELTRALGEEFTSTFTAVLRSDWQRFLRHVTDWEISEYREML